MLTRGGPTPNGKCHLRFPIFQPFPEEQSWENAIGEKSSLKKSRWTPWRVLENLIVTKSWNPDEQNTLNLESRYTGRFGDKSGNKLEARSTFKTMVYWTVGEAPPPLFEKMCHFNQGASTAYVTFCLFLLLYKHMKMLSRINVKMITFTKAITFNLVDPHFWFWSSWGNPFNQLSS